MENVICLHLFEVHISICPLGNCSASGHPAGSWCLSGSDTFNLETASLFPRKHSFPNALPGMCGTSCVNAFKQEESPSGGRTYLSTSSLPSTFICTPSSNHDNGPAVLQQEERKQDKGSSVIN